eukprot:3850020-Lingulodinium_polyedra.AAC.1
MTPATIKREQVSCTTLHGVPGCEAAKIKSLNGYVDKGVTTRRSKPAAWPRTKETDNTTSRS